MFQSFELLESEKKKKPSEKKSYTLHDSIYIPLLRWQNYRDWKKVRGCQELGGVGWEEGRSNTGEGRPILYTVELG